MTAPTTETAESALIATNVRWLRQAMALVESIDDTLFISSPKRLAPHRAGSHLRHILEFYQCFLEGLGCRYIDYDGRRRDVSLEQSRHAAVTCIRGIIHRLEALSRRDFGVVWVRMEDSDASGIDDGFLDSSVSRELQVLSSHTIHHFALMAVTLRMLGHETDPSFGVAPSTLRHQAALCAR